MNDAFKELIWSALVKAAIARLFVLLPWLGWGPVGLIVGWVITHFADQLYDATKEAVEIQAIALRNEAHKRAFDTASTKLKVIAHDKGIDSEEFKNAREEQRKALSTFVRFAA